MKNPKLQSVEEKVKEFMQIYPVSKIEELNHGCAIDVVSNLRSDVKKTLTQDRTTLRDTLLKALEEKRLTGFLRGIDDEDKAFNQALDEAKVIISKICL